MSGRARPAEEVRAAISDCTRRRTETRMRLDMYIHGFTPHQGLAGSGLAQGMPGHGREVAGPAPERR